MIRSKRPYGLGVYSVNNTIYLYHNAPDQKTAEFVCELSESGFGFNTWDKKPVLVDQKQRVQTVTTISDFRISKVADTYIMVYKLISDTKPDVRLAISKDLVKWDKQGIVKGVKEVGQVVPNFLFGGKYVMFFGEEEIKIAYSSDLKNWVVSDAPIMSPRAHCFDQAPLMVGDIEVEDEGIVLFYFVLNVHDDSPCYSIGRATFDKNNPARLIERQAAALLTHVEGMSGKEVMPVGIIKKDDTIISYWDVEGEGIVAIGHPARKTEEAGEKKTFKLVLKKIASNPILKPIVSHFWENRAVFNPAAIYDNGKVHLIYRAIGDKDISTLGYASTTDGTSIDERLSDPIYVPRKAFELGGSGGGVYTGSPYASGGGEYGGCEDPRLTKVGDMMYLMYVAYDGANPPRVALSKLSLEDFRNKNWNWSDPVLVSRPGVVDKNACVLPEKINGKYVIFHRIYPNILVDYVDDMNIFDGNTFLKDEFKIGPRPAMWDSRKVGIGAPPIKTDQGWLLIYQAVGNQDPSRYKVGAMILDINDPTKVLYRSKNPILEPDSWHENEGHKYGVAYPCGAVIHDEMLRVYYGGADTVVCEAHAPAKEFIDGLTRDTHIQLTATKVKSVI